MNKIKIMQRNNGLLKPFTLAIATLLVAPSLAFAAFTPITSQLDQGQRGTNVTNLQTFLAANAAVYPQGLVTGYYGPLTTNAVKAFQSLYGISTVGRVGPQTIAKINEVISSGTWGNGSAGGPTSGDGSGPQFTSISQNIGQTSATFTWTTNENATAKIFYDRNPVMMNEGDINSVGFGPTTGLTVGNDNQLRTSQSVTISNLQPGTTYHYTRVSTDANGNVSVWNPNTTFTTSF
jgi:peptidoglycan hydrolase-like protein with peptidoglycan-binding domain